jgi:Flp pilus assembly protein TadB
VIAVACAAVASALSAWLAWAYPRRARQLSNFDAPALERELAGAESEQERAASLNETIAALDHRLQAREGWPRAALWLAMAASAACATAGFIAGARLELVFVVPVAVANIAACQAAREVGRRRSASERARIDGLVDALARTEPLPALPERRRMRWRKKR